jgi:hypothetical protein
MSAFQVRGTSTPSDVSLIRRCSSWRVGNDAGGQGNNADQKEACFTDRGLTGASLPLALSLRQIPLTGWHYSAAADVNFLQLFKRVGKRMCVSAGHPYPSRLPRKQRTLCCQSRVCP